MDLPYYLQSVLSIPIVYLYFDMYKSCVPITSITSEIGTWVWGLCTVCPITFEIHGYKRTIWHAVDVIKTEVVNQYSMVYFQMDSVAVKTATLLCYSRLINNIDDKM